ncbi:hypothetical protein BCR44DRAFT_1154278 [Catenaria anguillulae PL171]|uniref:Uncharacterized protein n=1 Tax=Catenaria anguillulae PL171 TaxID=765915 RepID=A0A1Y2HIU2_9FUNG|nr:hypothetical protein BCR44DRAFT_1154278 [Catenaria anguillulae PL171]
MHGVGYLIELSRRFFYIAWPLAAILVESRELALICSALSIDEVKYVLDPLGRADFRRWIRDFALIQLGTTMLSLINLSILLQTFTFLNLDNTIVVLYNTCLMGRRQIWSFAWLVLGSTLPWHLPQYPGLAIHSFICRMYILVQLMCLDNVSRFAPHCHVLLQPSSSQTITDVSQKPSGDGKKSHTGGEGNQATTSSRSVVASESADKGSRRSTANIKAARMNVSVPVVVGIINRVESSTSESDEPLGRAGPQRGGYQDAPLTNHSPLLSPHSASVAGSMAFASPLGSHATFESAKSNQSSSGHMPSAMASRQN